MQILLRGNHLQRARLISGLILFLFALAHFLNHAVGLVSLETMHEIQLMRLTVTRSLIGSIILGGALATHMLLGLYKFAERKTFKLPPWEMAQLCMGILIPFLLFPHMVNTRVASTYFGVQDSYLYELAKLWPASAIVQSTLLLLVWTHGCIGIHFWLRLYSPYRAMQPVLLFIAIAIPLAAIAGFAVSGRAIAQLIESPERLAQVKELTRWPNDAGNDRLGELRGMVRLLFASLLAAILAYIAFRYVQRMAAPKFAVRYIGGPTIQSVPGPSLLEISRMNRIPHASVCGGRARCSTCRVRVDDTAAPLPMPGYAEAITLGSIQAPENVRLACQIRPTAAITVTRLLRPGSTGPNAADLQEMDSGGVERKLVALHVNMREFTELSKKKLPYDLVFILNAFFNAVGSSITTHDGFIDRCAGDGLYAVFGQRSGPEAGSREALRAARAIDLALDHVNAVLSNEIAKPLRVGMGIHAGTLLLGRVGYGEAVDMTAIGPAVKAARMLEGAAKALDCQIVMSADVAKLAGWPQLESVVKDVDVPGAGNAAVVTMARGRDMPATILAGGRSTAGAEDSAVPA